MKPILHSMIWIFGMGFLALGLACGGSGSSTPTPSPTPAPTVAPSPTPLPSSAPGDFVQALKTRLQTYGSTIATQVASADSPTYYSVSYYLHGMASAAEATGDVEVMDGLVADVLEILGTAQPLVRNGTTYMELPPWDANGNPQQLDTFQITGAIARTAAVIALNPAFKTRYASQFAQITAFVDQSVFQYWFDKQSGVYADPKSSRLGGQIPWLSTALGGWGTYAVWSDKCSHLGMMATWMFQATGNPLYREYAQRVAQGFRDHVVMQDGCLLWDKGIIPYDYDGNFGASPDTSHANREPMMAVAMYEAGIEFQAADLQGLTQTFLRLIWNQSETDIRFANYIDGGNAAFRTTPAWGNGAVYLGWAMLGRYSPQAQRLLILTDRAIQTQQPLNPSLAYNASSYGRIELAGTLARNAATP